MTGALWAALAGVGFGLFQALNRRALKTMDAYLATFLQLAISLVVLAAAAAASGELARLGEATPLSVLYFSLAGMLHFFLGWTLMNMSQQRIGAARTSPLIGLAPIFALVVAALTLGELPTLSDWLGMAIVMAGVYVIFGRPAPRLGIVAGAAPVGAGWRDLSFGVGTAVCWAISPIFTRAGLAELPSPLVGVMIGLMPCVLAYGLALAGRRAGGGRARFTRDALAFKLVAGVLVGLSTWWRWIALDLALVGVVLALSQLSVPVVILLTPLIAGQGAEQVTRRVWAGAGLSVAGSLVLVLL
ncbi:MAG TPA: DMT family transporter [Chloroflexaceae bacterium]|nr:DMT family transporter [Chloroflexaceae bacterium]